MAACYTTAVQALIDVGHREKGKTVLIPSACGGVGLVAIQLCRMIGAEIYATCGNEEKVQHLVNNCDIPRNRIFNSHDDSFLADVMRETEGRGVDIILDSLSGELFTHHGNVLLNS